MPYSLYKQEGKYCVRNSETGEGKGCSDSRSMAVKHMRALYAAEGGAKMGKKKSINPATIDALVDKAVQDFIDEYPEEANALKELGVTTPQEEETKEVYTEGIWNGATSYAELDAMHMAQERVMEINELVYAFPGLARNILLSDEGGESDKLSRINALSKELQSRMKSAMSGEDHDMKELEEDEEKAISKREDVSEADKKRAVGEYGDVTYADEKNKKYPIDTEEHIRAAWNYINKSKNAGKYSSGEVSTIKRKIVSAWKKKIDKAGPPSATKERIINFIKALFDGEDEEEEVKEAEADEENILIYKETDGSWRWLARYSNNFRDRDNPPEIISAESHRRFEEKVEKGLAPLPEYRIWHVKEWKVGHATWVAHDQTPDGSVFALAGGVFEPGMEQVAEWLSTKEDARNSHGMPPQAIVYDANDPTIIIEHETREISVLPAWAAANPLTENVLLKENDMAIPAEKRKTLIEKWGMPEELLVKVEAANAATAEKAVEEGLESKEVTPEADTPAPEAATPPAETPPAETTAPEAEKKETPQAEVPAITREEIADAITIYLDPAIKQINYLTEKVKELTEKLNSVETDATEKAKELLEQTPYASLTHVLSNRAVGNHFTAITNTDPLAKEKPKEAPAESNATGIAVLDQIFSGNGRK